jgi:hypothetical protein
MRNEARYMFTPVKEWITAAPPRTSMAVTIVLVINAKNKKTLYALSPNLAFIISGKVCEDGAFALAQLLECQRGPSGY